jgi:histidyl-tRNA synthetase
VQEAQLLPTYAAIDKLARESAERTRERLARAGIAAATTERVLELFTLRELAGLRERFGHLAGVAEELTRLDAWAEHVSDLGHGDRIAFDPTIVRGLAYYTGTVFEIFDRAGELRAVCGGGRYDRLLGSLGGADLPAVGFGMGDVVLGELLAERGLIAAWKPRVEYFIVAVGEAQRSLQRRIATRLRARGHSVAWAFREQSVGRQFKEADARGAARTIVVGPDEVAQGMAVIREMAGGSEHRVSLQELLEA